MPWTNSNSIWVERCVPFGICPTTSNAGFDSANGMLIKAQNEAKIYSLTNMLSRCYWLNVSNLQP